MRDVERVCADVYGVVGRKYVKNLVADQGKAKIKANQYLSEFMDKLSAPMKGWERRFAYRFAIVYAAGMLGIDFGILPWKREVIMQTCEDCYASARANIPNYNDILASSLAKLKQQLEKDNCCVDLIENPNSKQLKNAAGYLLNHPKLGPYFAIKPNQFEKWLRNDISPRLVAAHLRKEGHLIATRQNIATKQVKISKLDKKRKHRYYCIKASFLKA